MRKRRAKNPYPLPEDAKYIEWSEIGPAEWRARTVFLKFIPGFTYTVRLFHKPVKFWLHVELEKKRIISEEAARLVTVGAMCRYAMNVIDRADQQVKMLEGSEQLFLEFRRCHELTGIDVGAMEGFDISIAVVGLPRKLDYRISYDAAKPTPFTETEKTMLKSERFLLSSIFAVPPTANA